MHTTKAADSDGAAFSPALAPPPVEPASEMVLVEEQVLRDVRHELGNYFHKLYYWADVVAGEEEQASRAALGERLAETIQRLEEYLKLAVQYFQPDHASCVPMTARQLGDAVAALLEAESPGAPVVTALAPGVEETAAMIDPSRFSAALRIAARQLNQAIGGAGWSRCACRMQASGGALEIEIEVPACGATSVAAEDLPIMEWALARKTIGMHGGSLSLSDAGSATRRCILTLPFAS